MQTAHHADLNKKKQSQKEMELPDLIEPSSNKVNVSPETTPLLPVEMETGDPQHRLNVETMEESDTTTVNQTTDTPLASMSKELNVEMNNETSTTGKTEKTE